jgi:hypothetical protein
VIFLKCEKCGKNIPEVLDYCPTCKINESTSSSLASNGISPAQPQIPSTGEASLNTTNTPPSKGNILLFGIKFIVFFLLLIPCYFLGFILLMLLCAAFGINADGWDAMLVALILAPILSLGIISLFSKNDKQEIL